MLRDCVGFCRERKFDFAELRRAKQAPSDTLKIYYNGVPLYLVQIETQSEGQSRVWVGLHYCQ